MKVPFLDLKIQYKALREEIMTSLDRICSESAFILGPAVQEFERSFATYLETGYTVGVGNGTESLTLCYQALGIERGAEVIIPAHTFVATAIGVLAAGARPVLVEISEDSYLMDYDAIEGAITSKTKAICPVHLYGRSCDMDRIMDIARRHSLAVVEDAAQAHGARWNGKRVGTFGEFGSFSFYPGKNLGAYGDGGAICTANQALAKKVAALRNYGSEKKYYHPEKGTNSRLDALQAAVLSIKLAHLEEWNKARHRAARTYCTYLKDLERSGRVKLPAIPTEEQHVFHLFVIQLDCREKVMEKLAAAGIDCGIHYPIPFYLQDGYKDLGYKNGSFPLTEKIAGRILSLPMFPEITAQQLERVCHVLSDAVSSCGS